MASMEDLVVEPVQFKFSNARALRIWQIIATVACIVAVVMTALFIWQVLKNGKQSNSCSTSGENGGITSKTTGTKDEYGQPCPALPNLYPITKELLPSRLQKALDSIHEDIGSYVNESIGLPAISLNVFYQDRVLQTSHFGRKVYKGESKPDSGTFYRIGSVTKIFVVLMVYKLYEEGVIDSLDDPLSKYAPEFYIQNPFTKQNITIRQIASQMSGLPREAPCIFVCNVTTDQQLQILFNRSLVVAPWSVPSYSNLGYALLGRLLPAHLLNTTFERWVEEKILKPLNMTDTGFDITEDVQRNFALPYFSNGTIMPFMKLGWIAPAGEMYSTINDMTKLGKLFVQPSKQNLLRPGNLREMMSPADVAPDGTTLWGAPWEIEFLDHFLIRGKGGSVDSYTAFFSVVPELQLGMTLFVSAKELATRYAFASEMSHDIYKTLLPAMNETLFHVKSPSKFKNPMPYVGNYTLKRTDAATSKIRSAVAEVVVENDRLVLYKHGKRFFDILDVGNKLIFQAYFGRPSQSCLWERLGTYEDLHFIPFDENGFSPGFTVPGYQSMTATRLAPTQ